MIEVEKVRVDFPWYQNNSGVTYLDSAATSLTPSSVIEGMNTYYRKLGASVHRGTHNLSINTTQEFEKARQKIARFINAKDSIEIIFTKNATESINVIALTLGQELDAGSKILLTEMEHHSNFLPWQFLANQRDLLLDYIAFDHEGILDMEEFESKLTKDVALVAVSGASNVLGTINPLPEICALAHRNDSLVLVDGSQLVPHKKVDVQQMDPDFLAFSAHKMLGPTGLGIMYGREKLLKKIPPLFGGGEMVKSVGKENSIWSDLPQKFEAGTPPIAEVIGFGAAVQYLNELGMENVKKHEDELVRKAFAEMKDIKGIEIYGPGPDEDRVGVLSFNLAGITSHEVATWLDSKYDIAIRAGHHCAQPAHEFMDVRSSARISFYVYNSISEIEKLIKALKEIKKR